MYITYLYIYFTHPLLWFCFHIQIVELTVLLYPWWIKKHYKHKYLHMSHKLIMLKNQNAFVLTFIPDTSVLASDFSYKKSNGPSAVSMTNITQVL